MAALKPVRLARGFFTVGGWTLASRLVGFIRDILIAAFVGAGAVAEAYFVASALPNMFRRFFGEGAFNTAFVPMVSKKMEAGEDARDFSERALSGLLLCVLVLTAIGMIAMPLLVRAMAWGMVGDERLALAITYGLICFPYIIFISLTALFSGLLNAGGRFVAAAAAPVLMNIVLIVAMVMADRWGWDMGLTMSWSTPIAGVAQLVMCWIAAARMGYPLRIVRPRLDPEMRHLLAIAAPAVVAGGVVQINFLVGRQVGSLFEGALAWLNYADRLYQLPLGVVAIAIGVVLLPDLSRRLRAGDVEGSRTAYSRATEIALLLTIPAAVALIVLAEPLISVLFQRGRFLESDVGPTALILAIYGAGLPAFTLQKVLQPLYFAREDTRRPFRFALHAMVVNAVIAIGLAPFIGYSAAALATTLAGWAMAAQLMWNTKDMGDAARWDDRLRKRLPRIVLASLIMGAALWGMQRLLETPLHTAGHRYLALAVLIVAGIAVYGVAAAALGLLRRADFRRAR